MICRAAKMSGWQFQSAQKNAFRLFMASSNYKRVSRKRLCRICGKPDWCSYTPDEKTSFCARVTTNADRVSRTGWGVFHHEKTLFLNHFDPPFAPRRDSLPKPALAPIEIRDFVYRKLIALAPATDSAEIIDGEKGLRARKIIDFENYGALPQSRGERRELAKFIRNSINRQFPDYVRRRKSAVEGLPGFWIDERERVQLWTDKDYAFPLLLIPYRDEKARVQACQIRYMCRAAGFENGFRYVWLSTPDKNGGSSCGSPLHFAHYETAATANRSVLITEGALKAETVRNFSPRCDVLASAGVNCSHDGIVAAARFRSVFIAFDADYYENAHVARAIARLIDSLSNDSAQTGFERQIKILTWKIGVKGVDDALLRNSPLAPVSPAEWFKSLSADCRIQVETSRQTAEKLYLRLL